MNLPFLKPKVWPQLRKMSGESKYGFEDDESEEDELAEHAIGELLMAHENKDSKQFMEALKALIHCIKSKEDTDDASIHKEA